MVIVRYLDYIHHLFEFIRECYFEMEEIKQICFKTLEAGARCIVVMDKVSVSNPNVEHYWVKITTETDTNKRHVLTTVPSCTLNRKEAIGWVDTIKSFDPRIESVGDGRLELI